MMAYLIADSITKGIEIPLYENGQMWRDWTYVEDITDGVVLALDKPLGYDILNLGRGEPTLLKDFVEEIENQAGRKGSFKAMPMIAADVIKTYSNTSKAQRILGYNPQVSVQEGVQAFWNWYNQEN